MPAESVHDLAAKSAVDPPTERLPMISLLSPTAILQWPEGVNGVILPQRTSSEEEPNQISCPLASPNIRQFQLLPPSIGST